MGEHSPLLADSQTSSIEDWTRSWGASRVKRERKDQGRCFRSFLILVAVLTTAASFILLLKTFLISRSHIARSPCTDSEAQCEIVAPFIFDSIHGLAKQWPNTYAPNGHSFVSALISRGTPLYHTTTPVTGDIENPTWLSFDPELGLGIFASIGKTEDHRFVTTKALQMLYIDGQGASLTNMGTLDSQTALLHGRVEVQPGLDFIFNDLQRGAELCQRAKQWKIDGFIRMQAGFEVLVCDRQSAGLKHVSVTNVTVPGQAGAHEDNPELPRDPNRVPPYGFGTIFAAQNAFEWIRSSTWYYGGYGPSPSTPKESRFHLDLCGFVSFYDPRLKSLKTSHHGGLRPGETFEMGWGLRRGHRLVDISHEDARSVSDWIGNAFRSILNRGFARESSKMSTKCSGVDWQTVTEVITTQHKSRAIELAGVLARKGNLSDQEIVNRILLLSHAVLHPFLQYPSSPGSSAEEAKNTVIHTCSTIYTAHLPADFYNTHEALIRDSIEIVLKKLCSWEMDLFLWADSRTTNQFQITKAQKTVNVASEIDSYNEKTASMIKWIGWDLWDKCDEPCVWNELCYIPMHPVVFSPGKHQGGPWGGSQYTEEEQVEFWRPKCISLEDFDRWGGRVYDPRFQLPDVPWINETVTTF